MNYREPLSDKAVAISISDSDDMELLGLAHEHLRDAMAEVSRHLLAFGARLNYGGDFRKDGFSELLFELVTRHRRDADVNDVRVAVTNYVPWPVHVTRSAKDMQALAHDVRDFARIICLDRRGVPMSLKDLRAKPRERVSAAEWAASMSAQRCVLTEASDFRVILGGQTQGFKGIMPGVAEEALWSLNTAKPLFVLGGFGGCARDIAEEIGLIQGSQDRADGWPGLQYFEGWDHTSLCNGLDAEENAELARTVHIDQAVAILLIGLLRLVGSKASHA
ncbi:MAG: hypothetical protein K8R60_05965 [Burkholderiales bacterium]|nr:hypothetical protein [Burkholderiales bacterium]